MSDSESHSDRLHNGPQHGGGLNSENSAITTATVLKAAKGSLQISYFVTF